MTDFVVLEPNEIAVARHGLILSHNEATGLTKVFKYLLGLGGAIEISNNGCPNTKNKRIHNI